MKNHITLQDQSFRRLLCSLRVMFIGMVARRPNNAAEENHCKAAYYQCDHGRTPVLVKSVPIEH